MFCSKCGTEATRADSTFCRNCGASLLSSQASPGVVVVKSGRNPGVAAVLSFFWCGLGQIYNGQIAKGIMLMILYAISILLIHVLLGIFTTPVLWLFGIIDAYRAAERLNREAGIG